MNINWNRELSRSCSVFRHFLRNLRKSKQISLKSAKIAKNFENNCKRFSISNFENAKTIWRMLLKYWGLSGAKTCKSCRSRQELSNEYLLAEIGVDTAEHESLKVHLIFKLWDLIFTEPPRPRSALQLLRLWSKERNDPRSGLVGFNRTANSSRPILGCIETDCSTSARKTLFAGTPSAWNNFWKGTFSNQWRDVRACVRACDSIQQWRAIYQGTQTWSDIRRSNQLPRRPPVPIFKNVWIIIY